jgi:hypothetical protein
MRVTRLRAGLFALLVVCVGAAALVTHHVNAVEAQGNFSLLVTPSPIVSTLKPGTATDIELKVRNGGTSTENLRITSRSFKFDSTTGQVHLNDTEPAEISSWITFANPTFIVQPGQWFTEKVHIALPKDTGFSYSFALVIARKDTPAPVGGQRLLNGSVADFTLINVDRPGATRKLVIPQFKATHGIYEYLPAEFNIQFKNTGNSIVQPSGNVFIQRGSNDKTPIASLAVNDKKGYILPGTQRDTTASWSDGFPYYKTTTGADGKPKQSLIWDWGKAKFANIRFGHYTAKLVAIYDDGTRDVPIQMEISFWVIPWRAIILLIVVVVGLYLLARWRGKKRTAKAVKKALAAADKAKKSPETKKENEAV